MTNAKARAAFATHIAMVQDIARDYATQAMHCAHLAMHAEPLPCAWQNTYDLRPKYKADAIRYQEGAALAHKAVADMMQLYNNM